MARHGPIVAPIILRERKSSLYTGRDYISPRDIPCPRRRSDNQRLSSSTPDGKLERVATEHMTELLDVVGLDEDDGSAGRGIDLYQFRQLWRALFPQRQFGERQWRITERVFDQIDADKSGIIEVGEMRNYMMDAAKVYEKICADRPTNTKEWLWAAVGMPSPEWGGPDMDRGIKQAIVALRFISQACVLLTVVVICIESEPSMQNEDLRVADNTGKSGSQVTWSIEYVTMVFFTVEFLAYSISHPPSDQTCKLVRETDWWVHFLSILPFYVSLAMEGSQGDFISSLVLARLARLMRLLRLLRLVRLVAGRGYGTPEIITVLRSAQEAIILFFIIVIIIVFLAGSLVYMAEKEDAIFDFSIRKWVRLNESSLLDAGQVTGFQSIRDSVYWAFGLLFGNRGGGNIGFPLTFWGQAIATIGCCISVILVAYPIGVFTMVMSERTEEDRAGGEQQEMVCTFAREVCGVRADGKSGLTSDLPHQDSITLQEHATSPELKAGATPAGADAWFGAPKKTEASRMQPSQHPHVTPEGGAQRRSWFGTAKKTEAGGMHPSQPEHPGQVLPRGTTPVAEAGSAWFGSPKRAESSQPRLRNQRQVIVSRTVSGMPSGTPELGAHRPVVRLSVDRDDAESVPETAVHLRSPSRRVASDAAQFAGSRGHAHGGAVPLPELGSDGSARGGAVRVDESAIRGRPLRRAIVVAQAELGLTEDQADALSSYTDIVAAYHRHAARTPPLQPTPLGPVPRQQLSPTSHSSPRRHQPSTVAPQPLAHMPELTQTCLQTLPHVTSVASLAPTAFTTAQGDPQLTPPHGEAAEPESRIERRVSEMLARHSQQQDATHQQLAAMMQQQLTATVAQPAAAPAVPGTTRS